jgi:hypothetical protein
MANFSLHSLSVENKPRPDARLPPLNALSPFRAPMSDLLPVPEDCPYVLGWIPDLNPVFVAEKSKPDREDPLNPSRRRANCMGQQ